MGDLAMLAKARRELEDLYLGVPDESVNLTFQDLAELKQNGVAEKKKSNMEPIQEVDIKEGLALGKSPSLDFAKALQAAKARQHHVDGEGMHTSWGHRHVAEGEGWQASRGHRRVEGEGLHESRDHHHHHHVVGEGMHASRGHHHAGLRSSVESSYIYDDVSGMSVTSMNPYQERGGRRRPGIPHSNICTVCSTYIYIFRHRCLVCGRVYCRRCVSVGMGEMTEGRKCIECLGKRFSQRYIERAGSIGCCARYPSMVKQQELKWAEKGPRRSGERGQGRSGMMSRSRSPITPRTPTRAHHVSSSPPSFVMSSPYSVYASTNHPIPF